MLMNRQWKICVTIKWLRHYTPVYRRSVNLLKFNPCICVCNRSLHHCKCARPGCVGMHSSATCSSASLHSYLLHAVQECDLHMGSQIQRLADSRTADPEVFLIQVRAILGLFKSLDRPRLLYYRAHSEYNPT
jgi:hypothetical protein